MKEITIKCGSNKERNEVGSRIHEQLRGNTDYIDSDIVLNIDEDKTVSLFITDGVTIPSIKF